MTVKIIVKYYPKIVVIAREVRLQDYSTHISPRLLNCKQSVKFSKITQRYSLTYNLLGIQLQYSLNRNTKNEFASRIIYIPVFVSQNKVNTIKTSYLCRVQGLRLCLYG